MQINNKGHMKKIKTLITIAALAFISCAPQVGVIIDAPAIPTLAKPDTRARLGSYVNLDKVQDTRMVGKIGTVEANVTEPYGNDITENIKTSIRQALSDVGVSSNDTAPVAMNVEIRSWKSQVGTKSGSGKIVSDASLYIELYDPTGKRLFSGSYNGQRTSDFPIISKVDIQDSLGLAMANAIEQMVTDPELINILGSFN